MNHVLVEDIVTTWNKSLGAARLRSSATLALIVGSHGPITANNSIGPPAFVVDNHLAAEIVEIALVFGLTVAAVNQTLHAIFRFIITGVSFRNPIQDNSVRTSKAHFCLGGSSFNSSSSLPWW